jgi:putative addiction module component (TIGR02574 family)
MTQELDISRLTPAECISLAEQLWEQARAHPEAVPVTQAQLEELHRRLDAIEAGNMPRGEPWESVRDRLLRR